ncbi:MAG: Clp protease ClpP [Muribaculaceae bacterium]|nr:Clp protease ClpP [Muribaculaceae bacterium]
MAKTNYNIQLKGWVGGCDFNLQDVDDVLAANGGQHVDVLIDSTGGSLATGLSISAAFKNHGDVSVHYVGLNASAATIASMGAKHVSIDANAMYLVHKVSVGFFDWSSKNSDEFAQLIEDCTKTKEDLDKLDLNVARLYAARCKRTPEELLELMSRGGWLTSDEALEWGFVDEVTDADAGVSPVLTNAVAAAMATAGMPIPRVPVADEAQDASFFTKLISALTSIFKPNQSSINNMENPTPAKTYSEEEYNNLEAQLTEANSKVSDLEARISELEAAAAETPAEPTSQVVENEKGSNEPEADEITDFCTVGSEAAKLFNSLP